jgi:DNA-binding CsgD family transcriptional regulator
MGALLTSQDYQRITTVAAALQDCSGMGDLMDASMRQLSRLVSAKSVMFMLTSSLNWKWEQARTLGLDQDYARLHHSQFHRDPGRPVLQQGWRLRRSQVLNSTLIFPADGEPKMPFYQQIFKPRNIRHSLALSMPVGDNFYATVVMFRSAAEGAFAAHEETVAEKLLPFLRGGLDRAHVEEKHRRLGWLLSQVGSDLDYREVAVIDRHLDVVCVYPEHSSLWSVLLEDIQRRDNRPARTTPDLQQVCRRMLRTEGDTRSNIVATFVDAEHWGRRIHLKLRRAWYGRTPVLSLFLCEPAAGDSQAMLPVTLTPHLTAQEKRVAAHIADGATNAQIARALGISATTAAHHVSAVLRKSGVKARWQLQATAHKTGDMTDRLQSLPLSARQRQILEARLSGLSTAATAAKHGIEEVTVRNHLRAAYRTLGVSGLRGVAALLKS